MKITVSGSIKLADKLVTVYYRLQELGHEPKMHKWMFKIADGTAIELIKGMSREHSAIKRKYDLIKWWHNCIKDSDAILVCNFDKGGVKNYIGGNTLMEMGFTHVNDKKVFLLNPIPENVPYVDEIKAMVDVVLNGDLKKIRD